MRVLFWAINTVIIITIIATITRLSVIEAEKELREILSERILERHAIFGTSFLFPPPDFLGIEIRYRDPREGFAWLTGETTVRDT